MTTPETAAPLAEKLPKEPGLLETIIATADSSAERLAAYQIADRRTRTRLATEAAEAVSQLSWGQAMPDKLRFQVARWCLERDLDPLRHIYILGGNLYDAAEYYFDELTRLKILKDVSIKMLAPLDERPLDVKDVGEHNIEALVRLQQDANAARLALQIKWAVPQEINEHRGSSAAALVELYFTDGTTTKGVNWAGSFGRKGKKGNATDPVGDEHPVKTAVTRAFRKAAKLKVPFSNIKAVIGDSGIEIDSILEHAREDRKRAAESVKQEGAAFDASYRHQRPPFELASVDGAVRDMNRRRVPGDADLPVTQVNASDPPAEHEDHYPQDAPGSPVTDAAGPEPESPPDPENVPQAPSVGSEHLRGGRMVLPWRGEMIGEMSTEELKRQRRFLRGCNKETADRYERESQAIEEHLEERRQLAEESG